jgi:hypothetical protein
MTRLERLIRYWPYGGLLAGIVMIGLTPALWEGWSPALVIMWLILPVFMIHQYEEFDDNAFARYADEVLDSDGIVPVGFSFALSIFGVWLPGVIVFWLAATVDIGWGLIGICVTGVNGVLHVAQGLYERRYHPGLLTSVMLFLPLSLWGAWTVYAEAHVTLLQQTVAASIALTGNLGLIVYAVRQSRRAGTQKEAKSDVR